jgi:mono/diheme cytochrome c family protein
MRTVSALALLLALPACSGGPRPRLPPGEVALTIDGRLEDGPLDLRAAELRNFPRRAFRGREPATGREALFEGVSVADLLAEAVRPKRGSDTLAVRGRDGREALVTRTRLKDLRPILADRADGKPIAEWAREAGAALEAPLLAWPDLEQPGLALDPRVPAWWVGGVSTLVVESWVRSYGRALALRPEASDQARRGVERVAGHCLPCHRVRGAGGTRGPDLALSLAGWPAERIAARLEPHSTQAWLPAGSDGDQARREIAAFLQAVASSPAPPEEWAEEPDEAPRRLPPPPGTPRPSVH